MRPKSDIYIKATVTAIRAAYPAYITADGSTFPRVEIYNVTETTPEDKDDSLRRVTAVVEAIANDAATAKSMAGNVAELLTGSDRITATGISDVYTEMLSCISITETDDEDRMIYRETINIETTFNVI